MQIKLIPPHPHPTILFTITLPDPPEYLGIPQAWAAQLHRLGSEDLEYPQTMLALDKTTWIIACLSSVTFDLSESREGCRNGEVRDESNTGRVICAFIDGQRIEWELTATQIEDKEAITCVEMLRSVCRDVQDSAVEAEREREAKYCVQDLRSSTSSEGGSSEGWSAQPKPNDKAETRKQGKHKKQRSLLMSLVASLVSPRSSSQSQAQPPSSRPLPPTPSPRPTAYSVSVNHPTPISGLSTVLRKRARSTLVDTFRRYVLSKLAVTLLPACTSVVLQPTYNSHIGYFATWVAQSMLERVEAEMEDMVREAGGVPDVFMNATVQSKRDFSMGELTWQEEFEQSQGSFALGIHGNRSSHALVGDMLPPSLDHTGDGYTEETDGCSVRTPPDRVPLESSPFVPETPVQSFSSQPQIPVANKDFITSSTVPRSPSPPTPPSTSPPSPLLSSPGPPTSSDTESPSTSGSSAITIVIPQPSFTPSAMTAYTALSTHRLRLRHLLRRLSAQAHILASEEHNLQTVLEVKARRRAWSNRDYMRKNSAEMRFLGFAVPPRRSPLGRCEPICAADVVVVSSLPATPTETEAQGAGYVVEGVNGPGKHRRRPSDGLVVTTAENNIMRLFPVCEEDEDEDDYDSSYAFSSVHADMSFAGQVECGLDAGGPSIRLVEDSILRDAEAGLLAPLPLQRHSVPIRPRTRSMIHPCPSLPFAPPLSPIATSPSSTDSTPPPSPAANIFPDIEEEKVEFDILEPQTKVELFDVYSGDEEDEDCTSPGEMGYKSEFTLSMDLPPPYQMGIGLHAMTRRYDSRNTGAHAR